MIKILIPSNAATAIMSVNATAPGAVHPSFPRQWKADASNCQNVDIQICHVFPQGSVMNIFAHCMDIMILAVDIYCMLVKVKPTNMFEGLLLNVSIQESEGTTEGILTMSYNDSHTTG